ncbi:unnamed protein product [Acanthoscelides obtectus]|uniref:Cathepsin L n=1 Tax=Acanthoscelides obtectus TaxID=200917 RepID=A0A9P0PNM3_ACAOB|nr:unnamed protein product [Acanthoscelides obtectus]CAK1672429.1 hypothetical protein AOBTE_LOCUS28883 [Acanthoscelides obtectus]
MKCALFFLFFAGVTADLEEWKNFKIRHGKAYTSSVEDRRRFSVFHENLKKILDHNERFNKGEVTYAMKVTKFTDMTEKELKDFLMNSYGGGMRSSDYSQDAAHESTDDQPSSVHIKELPKTIDWRNQGAVTKVKDQGMCGSCWAFSAVGALEGQHYKSNGTLLDLSAQDLVDCADGTYGNMGCKGGLMSYAYDYVKDKGILTENEYPYKGHQESCKQKGNGFKIKSYINITIKDENALTQAVATIGPISCCMDASCMSSYSHGIVDSTCGCDSDRYSMNHGVLVVGYGEEKGIEYWIVKNSWGADWGEKGYFRLKKDGQNTCGIATDSSYPLA